MAAMKERRAILGATRIFLVVEAAAIDGELSVMVQSLRAIVATAALVQR
jgi:hypothetical protein